MAVYKIKSTGEVYTGRIIEVGGVKYTTRTGAFEGGSVGSRELVSVSNPIKRRSKTSPKPRPSMSRKKPATHRSTSGRPRRPSRSLVNRNRAPMPKGRVVPVPLSGQESVSTARRPKLSRSNPKSGRRSY